MQMRPVVRRDDASEHCDAERATDLAAVSFTAEPTPARLVGSAPMIDSVAGAEARARPAPSSSIATPSRPYPVVVVIVAPSNKPAASASMPATTTTFVPKRPTSFEENGPSTIMDAANGKVPSPAWNGE